MGILTPLSKAAEVTKDIAGSGIKSSLHETLVSLGSRGSNYFKDLIVDHARKYFGAQTDAIKSDATYRNISSGSEILKTLYTKPKALLGIPLRYAYAGLQSLGMSTFKLPRSTLKFAGGSSYDITKGTIGVGGSTLGGIIAGSGAGLQSIGSGLKDIVTTSGNTTSPKIDDKK